MLAYYIALSGSPESVNNYYSLYEKITPDDLMNIAKKYFIESALTIGTISADDTCPVK
jgi:zinc protease